MNTPPKDPPQPPRNPRLHAVNPGDERPRSKLWEQAKIAAITTLVGAAALGIGVASWKFAVKRTQRLIRREQKQQREETPNFAAYPPPQAVGMPYHPYMPPSFYSHPWTPSERDRMPEALREIPNFQPVQPVPNSAAPPPGATFISPPPPSADPNLRRFMDDMSKRLKNIESYLQDDPDDDDDDDDDRHARGRGKN